MYLAQPEQQTLQPFLTPQALKALSTELGFWYLCLHTFFLSCMAYWKVSIILCWSIFFLNVWTIRLGSDERPSTSDLYRQGNLRYCRASSMFLIITWLIVLVLGLLKWRGINHVCWCTLLIWGEHIHYSCQGCYLFMVYIHHTHMIVPFRSNLHGGTGGCAALHDKSSMSPPPLLAAAPHPITQEFSRFVHQTWLQSLH